MAKICAIQWLAKTLRANALRNQILNLKLSSLITAVKPSISNLLIERLEFCDVNDEFSGVCKPKNYYIAPEELYPGDPCKATDFKAACAYGMQQYTLYVYLYQVWRRWILLISRPWWGMRLERWLPFLSVLQDGQMH